MADILLKKQDIEDILLFDIEVEDNDIVKDDTYLTASIISIFTDASIPQLGTQIDGKTLGNKYYRIDKLTTENIKLYEKGLRDSLQWLIDDSIVSSIDIKTEKEENRFNIEISFNTEKENENNLKYSLDESFNILN